MEIIRAIVRPLVGLAFIGLIVYLVYTGADMLDWVKATAATIVGFYFGERSQK